MNFSVSSQTIFAWLDQHNIAYQTYEHQAVFTVEEAEHATGHIAGIDAKTLLVTTEKTKEL